MAFLDLLYLGRGDLFIYIIENVVTKSYVKVIYKCKGKEVFSEWMKCLRSIPQ